MSFYSPTVSTVSDAPIAEVWLKGAPSNRTVFKGSAAELPAEISALETDGYAIEIRLDGETAYSAAIASMHLSRRGRA